MISKLEEMDLKAMVRTHEKVYKKIRKLANNYDPNKPDSCCIIS